MNFRAAIIQHEDSTPPGSTLEWLKENNIYFQVFHLGKGDSLPSLSDFEMLIICGGSMNVDEDSKFSWMKSEKKLISDAISENKFVIGLCLGSQLIAEVLGGLVKKHPVSEVGWQDVQLINADGFNFEPSLRVYHWHGYSFEVPQGGKLIATNNACKNQAFVYGQNVLAFQFHPETTKEWVIECANSERIPEGPFCQTRAKMLAETDQQQPRLQQWYFKALDQGKNKWLSGY